jgi:hypothetical protein
MLSPDQWKAITQQVSLPWGRAELLCDGVRLQLQVERSSKTAIKYAVMVYIDGKIEWSLVNKPDDNAKKFWREENKAAWPAATVAKCLKGLPKRSHARVFKEMGFDKKITYFWPNFNTPSTLIRKLKANCTQIQLLGPDSLVNPSASEADHGN